MRILIIVAMTTLAIGCPLAGSKTPLTDRCPKTSPEARGLQPVECPAAWPSQTALGATLKSAEFWDMGITPGAPLCEAGKNEEIDITGPVSRPDVGRTYANGAKLLISAPGMPVECWTADENRFRTGHFNDGLVCYFKPTGDRAKDEIKITELEKLTPTSEPFNLRLGMSRLEVQLALKTQGARIHAAEGHELHATLTDGKKITTLLAHEDTIREIDVQATGTEDNPYMPLKHRFGVPDTDWAADKSQHTSAFWTGEPHIRIEMFPLHVTAVTGWRLRLVDLAQTE